MQKKCMVVSVFGLLLVLAAAGCSDKECASCPDPAVTPLGYTKAALQLNPGAVVQPSLEVFGNGMVAPNLDSVKIGDSLVNRRDWMMTSGSMYADAHWAIVFSEDGDTSTYMYEHGDTATISVWGEGRSSSCRVKILSRNSAIAYITTPAYQADTIAPGASDTVFWNRVEHADYYAVMVPWRVISGGSAMWHFDYYYATDTSFIVAGAMQPDSLINFDVQVTPFNGPDPQSGQTNWRGTLLDGVVFSAGYPGMTNIVIRPPITMAARALSPAAEERPNVSPEEMVSNVYKKFGK